MNLDFGQIVTQIIGFVIAVLILKRFAWGPILKLLDERRAAIAGRFAEADTAKQGAERLRSDYEGRMREVDADARRKMQEAIGEGQRVATQIKEDARREGREAVARARDEAERERAKARILLRDDIVKMALSATEKVVGEKLDAERHRRLVGEFIEDVGKIQN
jgi:F-type H+-transporting ATPase subunit b